MNATDVKVAHAFGYTAAQMVGLLPQPGECLHLSGCWEPAAPGSDHCAVHGVPVYTQPSYGRSLMPCKAGAS